MTESLNTRFAAVFRQSETLYIEAALKERFAREEAVARGDEKAEKRYSATYSRLIGYAGKEAQKARNFEEAAKLESQND